MSCSKNIIECLRDKNVQPLAFTNKEDCKYVASNAIDYSTSEEFASSNDGSESWIAVDFKQNVTIEKYQIKSSASFTDKLYSWTAYASYDDSKYYMIDSISEKEIPNNKNK